MLTVDDFGFLATTPIYYLGYDDHYVSVTPHGLVYTSLEGTSEVQGNLFLYHNRNSRYPLENTPFASFVIK